MKFEIYKITNLINKKIYIGQTSRGVNNRFKQHCVSNSIIGNAIKKYGKENFIFEILYTVYDKKLADELEEECVNKYNSYGKNGYNASSTGRGTWDKKRPISHMETYVNIATDIKWYINFTQIEKGRLFDLIQHICIFNMRIMYGSNSQQYCRTWQDLSKVLNVSYNTLKQTFIPKLRNKNIIIKEGKALIFNKKFIYKLSN